MKIAAFWVERFLIARAASFSVGGSSGSLLEQLAAGYSGKGVTFHAMPKDRRGELADDAQIWAMLDARQQRILELQNSPKPVIEQYLPSAFAPKGDEGDVFVPRSELLENLDGEITHTSEGDAVARTEEGGLITEERNGVEVVRAHRRLAPFFTLEDIAHEMGMTVPAVRWAIKRAHAVIGRALAARAAQQRECA